MKYKIIAFLIITVACTHNSPQISGNLDFLTPNSIRLTLKNTGNENYYFSFKKLNQPDNNGPYYNHFEVNQIKETFEMDSLRSEAFLNYLWANNVNGFDSSLIFGLDSTNEKIFLKGAFFFLPKNSTTEIDFTIIGNDSIENYPIIFENIKLQGARKKVIDDFYSKGRIGEFKPYRNEIIINEVTYL